MHTRLFLIAVCLGLAASSCGGGDRPAQSGAARGASTPSPGATSGGTGRASASPDALSSQALAPGQPGSSRPSLPEKAPGIKEAPLVVAMGSECLTPGLAQTITIRSTAGFQFAWATLWPDGGGHAEWKGWETGVIPPGGVYTQSFVVPPTAPLGDARTDVTVVGKIDGEDAAAMRHPYWRIAKDC